MDLLPAGPSGSSRSVLFFQDQTSPVPYRENYQGAYYTQDGRLTLDAGFKFTSTLGGTTVWKVGTPYLPFPTTGSTYISNVRHYNNEQTVVWRIGQPYSQPYDWTICVFIKDNTTNAVTRAYGSTQSSMSPQYTDNATYRLWDLQWTAPAGSSVYAVVVHDGMDASPTPAWDSPFNPAWQCKYIEGVTQSWDGDEFYLVNGPGGENPSLAFWEPYSPAWHTPQHKWPDVYMQGNVNTWGDKGGFFFRMSQDRKSYWFIDRDGFYFIDHGVRHTKQLWTHRLLSSTGYTYDHSADWFEFTAVGDYLEVRVRNRTISAGEDKYLFTDARNQDCTIHGCLDYANAYYKTNFSYLDIDQAGEYGYPVNVLVVDVDTSGNVSVDVIKNITNNGSDFVGNGQTEGRSVYSMRGPGDTAVALVLHSVNTYAWVPYPWKAYCVSADKSIHVYDLGMASDNLDTYADSLTGAEAVVFSDYIQQPDDNYTNYELDATWFGPRVQSIRTGSPVKNVLFHPRPTGGSQ